MNMAQQEGLFPLLKIREPKVGVFELEKEVDSEPRYAAPEIGLADLKKPSQQIGADALVNRPSQIDGFEELKRRRAIA